MSYSSAHAWRRTPDVRLMLGPTRLILGLLILSLGSGLAAEWLLAPGHMRIDGILIQPGGENRDNVTSLAWTPSDDLLVGTGEGRLYTYASDGEVSISNRHRMIHTVAPGNANGHYTIELETDMDQRPIPAPDNTVERTGMWRTDLSDASASIPTIDGLFAVGAPRADGQRSVLLGRFFHPLEAKAQGAPLARPSIIMTQRLMGPGGLADISGPVLVENEVVGRPPPAFFGTDTRALATTPDGRTAIIGTGDGNVFTVNLTWSSVVEGPDAYQRADYDAPIVAVAAGGPPTQPVLASASADGRVLVHRPDATQALSLVTALYDVEAALPAADWSLIGQSRETWSSLVGISGDGDTLAVTNGAEVVFVNSRNINDTSSNLHVTLPEGNYDARSIIKSLFASEPAGFTLRPFSFRAPPPHLLNSDMTGTFVVVSNNSEDGVELYNAVAGRTIIRLALASTPAATAFSPSGDVLAVISEDLSISLYGTSFGHMLTRSDSPGINARPVDMAFSPDGRRLVVALSSGLYQLYSTRTLRPIFREPETELKSEADISHDGSRLVRKISDESFEVVDLFTGHTLMQMNYGNDIAELMISGDGSTVAVGDFAGIVSVFREGGEARPGDARYSALLDTVLAGPPARDGLKLSADGSRLLLRTNDGRVFVAGTSERRPYRLGGNDTGFYAFRELQLHSPAVVADIAPDGSFAIVSDTTNHLDLHDLSAPPDAQPIRLLDGGGVVPHIAIASDGRRLAAANLDGRLSLVDLARARLVAALPLAHLAAHPTPPLMRPRELDEPPGAFPNSDEPGEGDLVIIGTHAQLEAAQEETARARAAGLEAGIFSRSGVFRTAVAIPSGQADNTLRHVRSLAPGWEGAYIRVKDSWCPAPRITDVTYCAESLTESPAAAN